MEIRVLGAHNVESANTRMLSLLIDDTLVVDAGALTSVLSFDEQKAVNSILLTHCHYDHIRDVAAIAINTSYFERTIRVYSLPATLDVIHEYILNGVIYPRFTEMPNPDNPPLRFCPLEIGKVEEVDGYKVLPVHVNHGEHAVGYQITSADGKSFFYSGDTGPGLGQCWEHVSPQLIIIDVTLPNGLAKHGVSTGHLTPRLLAEELAGFKKIKNYLPKVVAVHVMPMFEDEIREEMAKVSEELGANITLGYEGLRLSL
jgi:cAMP phosphodiesterase